VLFITHDLHLMAQASDRIGIMLEGRTGRGQRCRGDLPCTAACVYAPAVGLDAEPQRRSGGRGREPMSDMVPILALDNVSKSFGRGAAQVRAARAVSFALHPGRTLALVGESGSGKTTAARLIMREYKPDEGRLMFRGAPVDSNASGDVKAYRRAVQMVFQDPFSSLNPVHTVRYHLERPLRLHQPGLGSRGAGGGHRGGAGAREARPGAHRPKVSA
jgi:ABC-type glutathione transport system ATPase component